MGDRGGWRAQGDPRPYPEAANSSARGFGSAIVLKETALTGGRALEI